MIAYDSRRTPDPTRMLSNETMELLRAALLIQCRAGNEPVPELRHAVHVVATEARQRSVPPETVLIQFKSLANDAGIAFPSDTSSERSIREWMVTACLTAYWADGEEPAE